MNLFLIDLDTLKKIGYVNKNVENTILTTSLRRVQDTMLEPIIGTSLFKRLLNGVKDNDLNANETILLQDYISQVLISAVDLRVCNHLTLEIRSKTVGKAQDEHITPATVEELSYLQDDLRKDFEVYRQRLIGYLKDNCDLFPEYKNYICSHENIKPDNGEPFTQMQFV